MCAKINQERVDRLRSEMKKRGLSAYYIPTADFHGSEYISGYFKVREYLSGFTGSAGTLLVTLEEAVLFTDGRYFLQAEQELRDSGIRLMKMGEPGVPEIPAYLAEVMPEGSILGLDMRLIFAKTGTELKECLEAKGISMRNEETLIDAVWENRSPMPKEPVFLLDEAYTGKSAAEKLSELRHLMEEQGAELHLLAALDDIAWLLNLRGNDISYNPVALAFAVISKEQVFLFLDGKKTDAQVRDFLKSLSVELRPYEEIYDFLSRQEAGTRIWLDPAAVNYRLLKSVPEGAKLVQLPGPVSYAKSIKTPAEVANMRLAHEKDGTAMCRFLCWLKEHIGRERITELSAAAKAEALRAEEEGYVEPSFETIAAYGPHAAMCHYGPTEETDLELLPKGLFLMDSGGQYLQGTTDITRTVVLGPVTEEEKLHFTLVLQGMIRLSMAKFVHGVRGLNLDYLARGPLWERGLDYRHGTGHGIGYFLNVHEGPNSFRWKLSKDMLQNCILEEGMITSNEPGYYQEGSHGIRTENLLVCQKEQESDYGVFLGFETLTLVPIDREGILPGILEKRELEWLNAYHRKVWERISPHLQEKERAWLLEATAPITK